MLIDDDIKILMLPTGSQKIILLIANPITIKYSSVKFNIWLPRVIIIAKFQWRNFPIKAQLFDPMEVRGKPFVKIFQMGNVPRFGEFQDMILCWNLDIPASYVDCMRHETNECDSFRYCLSEYFHSLPSFLNSVEIC